jgi:hypothetical protein
VMHDIRDKMRARATLASLSTLKLDPAVQEFRSQTFRSESDGSIFS